MELHKSLKGVYVGGCKAPDVRDIVASQQCVSEKFMSRAIKPTHFQLQLPSYRILAADAELETRLSRNDSKDWSDGISDMLSELVTCSRKLHHTNTHAI